MRILIVEDEPPIADYIERSVRSILGGALREVRTAYSLNEALGALKERPADLCLLDLNLSGKDGYEVLKSAVSRPSHTIVISAHTEQAARAFEYGVLDFVPKPFSLDRLRQALDRYLGPGRSPNPARYLTYRQKNRNQLLPVSDIVLFKASRYLVEAWTKEGGRAVLEKPLNRLEQILPENFVRTHRSYIVNLDFAESYKHRGGSRYAIRMKSGEVLPLGRGRLAKLKGLLGLS
jgi:two-component system response regulator LytT